MNESDNFTDLRLLLLSWNCLELFPHFCEEGINIEELQLMKFHHIDLLLYNFKLGIRIRFEHYFEIWRQNLDKPLQCTSARCRNCCITAPLMRRSFTYKSQVLSSSAEEANHSVSSPPLQMPPLHRAPILKLPAISSTCSLRTPLIDSPIYDSIPDQPDNFTLPNDEQEEEIVSQTIEKVEEDENKPESTSVLSILQGLEYNGINIFDYYKVNKRLACEHRAQIINAIVSYFRSNNIHMSLNASYDLEQQILDIFPNEKLESYRLNKRGKLYIKYSNSKRSHDFHSNSKRKRNPLKRRLARNIERNCKKISTTATKEKDFVDYCVKLPLDVKIKTEKVDEEKCLDKSI